MYANKQPPKKTTTKKAQPQNDIAKRAANHWKAGATRRGK